jgi:ureidoglycolate dehydrogenase (NAD+)
MATSSIPWNRVMNARREGHALPAGVAIDGEGVTTHSASDAAALLPLGGSEYGHKGYALALMIELLCGPLNGMPYADRIAPMFSDLHAQRHLLAGDGARSDAFCQPRCWPRRCAAIKTLRRQSGYVSSPRNAAKSAHVRAYRSTGLWAEFADWSTRLAFNCRRPDEA